VKLTDMTYLRNFCEDDDGKMNKYIVMFLASAPIVIEKINSALRENDFTEIADQLHGFKTKFTMMGMISTGALSVNMEQQCRAATPSHNTKSDIRRILADIERAMSELS
jgi:HPt (histidine-containing phosphotransfer) domain-containing protein